MTKLSITAKLFIALMLLSGAAVLLNGLLHLRPAGPVQFAAYFVLGIAASRLKVRLPGVHGTMSVNLPFFLIAATQLSVSEALLIAFCGSIAQSVPASKVAFSPVRMAFNSAVVTSAVALSAFTFRTMMDHGAALSLGIAAASAAFFIANTLPVAIVLWLAEAARPARTWLEIADLTIPYYVLSAGVVAIVCGARNPGAWTMALILFATMYLIYTSYRRYFIPMAAAKPVAAVGSRPAAASQSSAG